MSKGPKIKKIFLVPMSHCDLGYTDLAADVRHKHVRHLRDVLALCQATENNAEGLKFKWTCEASWTVKEFLSRATETQKQSLFHYARTGQIEIGGFFGVLQFELASLEELIRCCEYSVSLARQDNFRIYSTVINDVPGFHSSLADVLGGYGIPYLLWGANAFRTLAGWTDLPCLFYLQSKGGNRTLVWHNGQDHRISPWDCIGFQSEYDFGDQFVIAPYRQAKGIQDDGNLSFAERSTAQAKGRQALDELLERMEYDRYPYDAILLQCAADNRGPDRELVTTVESLNRDYPDLTFVLATPSEFFRYLEKKHGPDIPAFSGDMIDSWSDGVGASAQATADYRQCQREIERLEVILARSGESLPKMLAKIRDVYENLLLYSEHTFGLSGWNWKTRNRQHLVQSWKEKCAFVGRAGEILKEIGRPESPRPGAISGDDLVCSQSMMENRYYRLTVSRSGRIESILDKELDRQLIVSDGEFPFNGLIFTSLTGISEDVPGKGAGKCDPVQSQVFVAEFRNVHMERLDDRVELTGEYVLDSAPIRIGGKSVVTLYSNEKRIDFVNTIYKEENANKEAVYFSFPFNLRKGNFRTHLEMPGHVLRFPEDLLSSSHSDFAGIQHFASLSDDDIAVTWLTHDAPLVEIGGIQTFKWAGSEYRPGSPVLFSYVMNNTWPTNFHLWQGGDFTFRYSLTSDRVFDPVRCYRFKQEVLFPEFAQFPICPENVILTGAHLNEDETVDLRFLEISGKAGVGSFSWPGAVRAGLTDLTGGQEASLPVSSSDDIAFPYSPHGLINIRISRKEHDDV